MMSLFIPLRFIDPSIKTSYNLMRYRVKGIINHHLMSSKQSLSLFPVVALLLSATLWGVLWYPMRLLEANGLLGLWATLIVFGTAMIIGLPLLWQRRHELQNSGYFLLLALTNGWCNTAFILAVLEGNVVRVLLLFYLSPLWTALLGKLILNESLSRSAKFILLLAMTGAMIMLWNAEVGLPWPQDRADWLAISSGLGFSLSNVLVRKVQDVSIWTKASIVWIGVTVVAGLLILLTVQPVPRVQGPVILSAVALGVFGIVIMTVAVLYGVTHMPVHRSAVILLFEVVAGVVSAQLLTNELVKINEWIGGILIISAALFATRSHAVETRLIQSEKPNETTIY